MERVTISAGEQFSSTFEVAGRSEFDIKFPLMDSITAILYGSDSADGTFRPTFHRSASNLIAGRIKDRKLEVRLTEKHLTHDGLYNEEGELIEAPAPFKFFRLFVNVPESVERVLELDWK